MVLVALAACTKATTSPAPESPTTSPAQAESPAAATSSGPPPVSGPPGAVRYYHCSSLLSDQEVQQATGLPDAALFTPGSERTQIKGQTYCQYFAKPAVSIAVSVYTGPAWDQLYQPLIAAAHAHSSPIPGLGDQAGWSAASNALGVHVGTTGVTIFLTNTGGGSLGISDPEGAAIAMAKLILSRL